MPRENAVRDKSFTFAIDIIELYKNLISKKEFVLSKQLFRCGTSIGANVREGEHAESKADFIHKLSIALKEANETDYWIDLLHQTDYVSEHEFQNIKLKLTEILKCW